MDIYIMRDGEETGPYSEDAAQGLLAQGDAAVTDLAWRPGMPQWIPLQSLLSPAEVEEDSSEMPEPEVESALPEPEVLPESVLPDPQPEPAPAVTPPEPAPAPTVSGEPATARQRAFLSYMGIDFPANATKEQAALLVNDAMESPRDPTRLARWHDDRLRLHPELFAAELQAKKEARPQHYFELTQTEGAECFDGVTKAHCQVLVGFLDISHPNWDANEREAAWNYFFPAIAEKFPQVVRKEWRGKLNFPKGPKVAREMKRAMPAVSAARVKSARKSSPVAALVKGLVYGAIVLGIGAGGYFLWQHPEHVIAARKQLEKTFGGTRNTAAAKTGKTAETAATSTGTAKSEPAPATTDSADSLFGPATTSPAPAPAGDQPSMAAVAPATGESMNAAPMGDANAAGGMAAAPAGDLPLFDPGTASASPTASNTDSLFAPATPPPTPAVAPRTKVVLTKSIDVQTSYGKVTVPAGTVLKLVAQEGDTVRVNYANSVIPVPVASTDLADAAPPMAGQ